MPRFLLLILSSTASADGRPFRLVEVADLGRDAGRQERAVRRLVDRRRHVYWIGIAAGRAGPLRDRPPHAGRQDRRRAAAAVQCADDGQRIRRRGIAGGGRHRLFLELRRPADLAVQAGRDAAAAHARRQAAVRRLCARCAAQSTDQRVRRSHARATPSRRIASSRSIWPTAR